MYFINIKIGTKNDKNIEVKSTMNSMVNLDNFIPS